MIIEAFKPEHLRALKLQSAQAFMRLDMTDDNVRLMADTDAYTVIGTDRVLLCGGLLKVWEGRALAWSLLAENIGAWHMMKIHHAAKRFLASRPERRIEADVDINHPEAHRWMRALGFVNETPKGRPGYTPRGQNFCLYARCK